MKLKQLSIGTFNLYNLNEPGLPIYTDRMGWSREEYERKIEWTSQMIRLLRPDIFGFQELWHSASLDRALGESGLADEYDLIIPEKCCWRADRLCRNCTQRIDDWRSRVDRALSRKGHAEKLG
jgi:hypothetical protein